MALMDNLQYRLENASLYFQGGVRRSVLIFSGVCILLLAPLYFLGQLSSNLWKQTWFDSQEIYIAKQIPQREYEISETQIVPLANGSRELYLSVNNFANREIGFFPWVYTLQVLDAGDSLLSQQTYRSYLLPEETKYIVHRSNDGNASKLRIIQEPATQAYRYNPNANRILKEPNIEIRSPGFELNSDDSLTIRAVFKNNDIVNVNSVNVLYIIRDTRQSVVGIGEYSFNGFSAGSEREMRLNYPKPKDREPRFLDIRWSVNYLDSRNILLGS